MPVARLALSTLTDGGPRLSDEIELYQRTYTTLLRSSGETRLRVLEPSHRAINSSLHPLADSDELDLGAFLYAIHRLPDAIIGARRIAMGQDDAALVAAGMPVETWQETEAAARRRRWYDDGAGTLAVLLASASDVDDLIPTLVAFQIEHNKIRVKQRAAGWEQTFAEQAPTPEDCARLLGGSPDDWGRLQETWDAEFGPRLAGIAARRMSLRIRMLGGSNAGYARLTRRWWIPVNRQLALPGLEERPVYFVSSNTHSIVNIVTSVARDREAELIAFVETMDPSDILRQELTAFREGRAEGSWENFLYFVARTYFACATVPPGGAERRSAEQASGITHLPSETALRVPAQVIPLAALQARRARSPDR